MFKKLFGIKTPVVEETKRIENVKTSNYSPCLVDNMNRSTLRLLTHQLFMHYMDKNAVPNITSPLWQNQGLFFWSAKEEFEKKSLPKEFKEYEHRYFIINHVPKGMTLSKAKVMPWFGMEGNGEKYFFENDGKHLYLRSLFESQHLQYVEMIELTDLNTAILFDRDNYYFLLDEETTTFDPKSDSFLYKGEETSLMAVYRHGGVKIIKLKQ